MASIPNDMLVEISSWLPAKAIHKFRSNNKFFSNFSKDKKFALKQSHNALLNDESSFFIQPDLSQRYGNMIELHHLSDEDNSSGVSKAVLEYLAKSAKILSSANGLILCRGTTGNSKDQIFISNPATQTWLPIPLPEQLQGMNNVDKVFNVILECDDKDNCMVYFFYDNPEFWSSPWDCKVYATKEGIWKEKEKSLLTGERSLQFDTPVFHDGDIHLISDCTSYVRKGKFDSRPYIMSYNFDNGTTRMSKVPKGAQRGFYDPSCNMKIFKWGKKTSSTQSICLVKLMRRVFTIWILTNSETNLWERILKIRVKAMGVMEEDPIITGFSVLNGDLLIFATKNKVYSYGLSFSNVNYMKLEEICEHGLDDDQVSFISYSNTLHSCGNDDAKPLLLHSTPLNTIQHHSTDDVKHIACNYPDSEKILHFHSLPKSNYLMWDLVLVFFFSIVMFLSFIIKF